MKDNNVLSIVQICRGSLLNDEAAAEFAKGLKTNTSLKELILRVATERAIKSISEALCHNRTLTKLCLHGHVQINDARAIQNMLAQNATLRSRFVFSHQLLFFISNYSLYDSHAVSHGAC